jgi:hypothetical protein
MEELLVELLRNLPAILAGLPLEWASIPDEHKRQVLTIALHCVLNGPVGVGKTTTFPTVGGQHKITDFVKTSNSGWKGFCLVVARRVKEMNPAIDCSNRRRYGDYWPIAERGK